MAIKTIYVQNEVTPAIKELLLSIHKRATRIVCYKDEVKIGDRQSIIDFFSSHRDPEEFIYIEDPMFVSVIQTEQWTWGCIVVDEDRTIHTFHHEHNANVHPHRRLRQITGMSRPVDPHSGESFYEVQ